MQNILLLAFLSSLFFIATILIIHLIKRDLQFNSNALSKYALGKHGWVLTAGLFAIGIAQIFLSISLLRNGYFSTGNNLLICAGVVTFFIALYKIEFPKKTYRGRFHTIAAGLQFTLFPLALIHLSQNFSGTWLNFYTTVTYTLNISLLIIIFIFFLKGTTHKSLYFGVVQKTNIILMATWVAIVSFNLM